jgi:site-specific recombinase XerD
MLALENVEILRNKSVFENIQTFIRYRSKRSKNTAKAYENDIRLFFKIVKHKELERLTPEDLKISLPEAYEYQNVLVDSGEFKNNTVNRKVNVIKSLYFFLKGCEYKVNPFVFKQVKDLPDDTENIDFLTPDEVWLLADLALTEQRDGLKKRALILTAGTTSIRKNAIRKLKLSHFKKSEEKENTYIIETDFFDKSKLIRKEIHENLYKLIKEAHGNKSEDEIIFDISNTAIDEMMKRLIKKAGFDPKRNISFHSLRKAGVMWVDEFTNGDMVAITAQGNWSSPTVAYNNYINKKRKVNLAGVGMFEYNDDSIFDELTREEMLKLLKSVGNGLGAQLKSKAKEIIDNRS